MPVNLRPQTQRTAEAPSSSVSAQRTGSHRQIGEQETQRRTTRSMTRSAEQASHSSAAASAQLSSPPPQRTGTKRTDTTRVCTEESKKKARFSARSYDLRSSTQQKQAEPAAAVTPATVTRHLNFDEASSTTTVSSKGSFSDHWPKGVVDIYSRAHKAGECHCIATGQWEDDVVGVWQHVAHYGPEVSDELRSREQREMDEFEALRESYTYESSASSTSTEDEDDESSQSSKPATPEPGTPVRLAVRERHYDDDEDSESRLHSMGESEAPLPKQPHVTPRMRSILVSWLFEMGFEYSVSEAAIHLAVTLLDNLLWKGPTEEQLNASDGHEHDISYPDSEDEEEPSWFLIRRSNFQAVGCACLWMASKMEDNRAPSWEDLVYVSNRAFSSSQLRRLEAKVFQELSFRLHRVTPAHYVNEFLRASHACRSGIACRHNHPVLRHMTMYLLELSRLPYKLSFVQPSLLAAAAIFLARATLGMRDKEQALDDNGYWTKTLDFYTGYCLDDIKEVVLTIHRFQLAAAEGSLLVQKIFRKYHSSEYRKVSAKTVLRVEDLGVDDIHHHDDLRTDPETNKLIL